MCNHMVSPVGQEPRYCRRKPMKEGFCLRQHPDWKPTEAPTEAMTEERKRRGEHNARLAKLSKQNVGTSIKIDAAIFLLRRSGHKVEKL